MPTHPLERRAGVPPEASPVEGRKDNKPVLALTGATGFIGGAMAAHFSASGWRVRALARDTSRATHLGRQGLELVIGSLADDGSLSTLVDGASAVVHCAGAVRGLTDEDFHSTNVEGVTRIATAAARQTPQPVFVSLSSLAAREPELSPYAASKRRGEQALADSAGDMCWVALRPPAVYGPGDRASLPLLQSLMRGTMLVPGTPENRFSLLYVEDLVAAVDACLSAGTSAAGGIFELHDGRPGGYDWHDLRDIAAHLRGKPVRMIVVPPWVLRAGAWLNKGWGRLSGETPLLTPGKVGELTHADWVCDNSAFTAVCGWAPSTAFAAGLRRTLAADDEPAKAS